MGKSILRRNSIYDKSSTEITNGNLVQTKPNGTRDDLLEVEADCMRLGMEFQIRTAWPRTELREASRSELRAELDEIIEIRLQRKPRFVSPSRANLESLAQSLRETQIDRDEIVVAAAKEIEIVSNNAIQMQQKLMDDFEWKLRQVESDCQRKIETVEQQYKNETKSQLDHSLAQTKLEWEAQHEQSVEQKIQQRQKIWEKEQLATLRKQMDLNAVELRSRNQRLQRIVDAIPAKLETERKVWQKDVDQDMVSKNIVKRELEIANQNQRRELDQLRSRVNCLESERQTAVVEVREQVEAEFCDKMESLRQIYVNQIEALQTNLSNAERRARVESAEPFRSSPRANCMQREFISSADAELVGRVKHLEAALKAKEGEIIKLQAEMDEYEWYDDCDEQVEKDKRQDQAKLSAAIESKCVPATQRPQMAPPALPSSQNPSADRCHEQQNSQFMDSSPGQNAKRKARRSSTALLHRCEREPEATTSTASIVPRVTQKSAQSSSGAGKKVLPIFANPSPGISRYGVETLAGGTGGPSPFQVSDRYRRSNQTAAPSLSSTTTAATNNNCAQQ